MTCSPPGSSVNRFSRQKYWSGLPYPYPGYLPDPRIEPVSSALAGEFFTTVPPGKPQHLVATDILGFGEGLWITVDGSEALQLVGACSPEMLGWLSGLFWGFPGGAMVKKNMPANSGDADLIPGSERSPEVGNGNPFQYSCLENSMDRGAWQAMVHSVTES